MRWYRAVLYGRVQTGTDETRNPVYELQETGETILVRKSPWVPSLDSTEGNGFDVEARTFLTKAKPSLLEGVVAIEVNGALYEVENAMMESDPTALRVRRFKVGV